MKTSIKIALSLIVFGLILALVGVGLGANLDLKNIYNISSEVKSENFSGIKSLNINLENYTIVIEPSSNDETIIEYPELTSGGKIQSKINFKTIDGTLYLGEEYKEKIKFKFEFPFSNKLFQNNRIKIKIPNNTTGIIDLSLGSVFIKNLELNDLNIDLEMGSVDIIKSQLKNININTEMGSATIKESTLENSKIETQMGSIELQGILKGDNEFSTQMGSIDANLNQEKESIGLSLSTEMSSVKINGKDGKLTEEKAQFKNFLKAKTEMGSIELNYKKP